MRARLTKLAAGVAVLAAFAAGGSALATAGSSKAKPAAVVHKSGGQPDGDNVQQGDQSAPDTASEQSGEQSSESASESGPSDGPGGYADTNANADTQQQGEN